MSDGRIIERSGKLQKRIQFTYAEIGSEFSGYRKCTHGNHSFQERCRLPDTFRTKQHPHKIHKTEGAQPLECAVKFVPDIVKNPGQNLRNAMQ